MLSKQFTTGEAITVSVGPSASELYKQSQADKSPNLVGVASGLVAVLVVALVIHWFRKS